MNRALRKRTVLVAGTVALLLCASPFWWPSKARRLEARAYDATLNWQRLEKGELWKSPGQLLDALQGKATQANYQKIWEESISELVKIGYFQERRIDFTKSPENCRQLNAKAMAELKELWLISWGKANESWIMCTARPEVIRKIEQFAREIDR